MNFLCLNKIDIRFKLFWLLFITSSAIFLTNLFVLFILSLIVIGTIFFSEIGKKTIIKKFKTISPFILIIIVFTTLFRQENPFIVFEMISLSKKGLSLGLVYSLRLIIIVLAFSIITSTTKTGEILEVLKKLRVPYPIVIGFLTTLRFIPTMKRRHQKIIEAQKTRGIDYENLNLIKKLKIDIKSLIPVFIEGVKRTETLTIALITRGFGDYKKKTQFYTFRVEKIDIKFLILTLTQFSLIYYVITI